MQAPNKVYILPSQYNLQYDNGGEEYICKDALLKWAKEMEEGTSGLISAAYAVMVNKIESL